MSFEQRIQESHERFQTLINRLSDTQWSLAAIPDAQSRLITCQRQIRLTQMKMNASNATAVKEHKRFITLKKYGIKHTWYKVRGTLQQSSNEQEKTWLREFHKCREEEQHLIVLREELDSSRKHMQQCQDAYEQYTTTKQELDDLLHYFFPDPDEDVQNLEKKKAYLVTLQNDDRILKHVFHLLNKAYRAITVSHRALNEASKSDSFPYCCFGNLIMGSYLSKARNASAQAQHILNEVQRLYPNIPLLDHLNIQQANSIFNIMFDNVWINTNMRKMINDPSNRTTCADAILVSVILQIKDKIEKCEAERNQTSKDIQQLTAEYFTTRITTVQKIIQSLPSYSPS